MRFAQQFRDVACSNACLLVVACFASRRFSFGDVRGVGLCSKHGVRLLVVHRVVRIPIVIVARVGVVFLQLRMSRVRLQNLVGVSTSPSRGNRG